ncbi:POM121-like protein 2 [Marmota monax]|uniref:POM121-like protein 2 n=1 Tax=Marmota monax TaxID=9995 RepID=UPI0026EF2CAD|nr:POM121-like protein 2 [Marmota monax]
MGLYLSRCLHRYLGTRKAALATLPLRPRRITQEHRPLRPRPAPRPQDPGICKPASGHPEPRDRSQALHKVLHSGQEGGGHPAWEVQSAQAAPLATPDTPTYQGPPRRHEAQTSPRPRPRLAPQPFQSPNESRGSREPLQVPTVPAGPRPLCQGDSVLKYLSQCNKGKRKFDGALWFEEPEPKRKQQSPQRRPSAFRPVIRNGVEPSFLPRPGPLKRSVRSRASASVRKRLSHGLPSSLPGASPGPCPTGPSSQASPGHGLTAPAAGLGADAPLSQEPRPSSPSQGPHQEGPAEPEHTQPARLLGS